MAKGMIGARMRTANFRMLRGGRRTTITYYPELMEGAGKTVIIFSLKEEKGALRRALKAFEDLDISLSHIESRSSKTNPATEYDFFAEFTCSETQKKTELVAKLNTYATSVRVVENGLPDTKSAQADLWEKEGVPWFPKTIHDLHRCCTNLLKYGHELTPDHPGFGDEAYIERRKHIAKVAKEYNYGNPIPRMDYTEQEIKTWGEIFRNQTRLYPSHACKEYNRHYPGMFQACGYREDNIPQLEDVSRYLKSKTGWQLWPVIGWIPARDFLNALAFRVFPTTQYIRHDSSPFYTPEPDICHELMGHAPLFYDPSFARFSQEIGLASLGVSEEWITKLAALYWYTVEFGVCCEEGGELRAYGAGLLSGSQELQYCITNQPEHRDFDIDVAMVTKYPESGLQPLYFVTESLDDMKNKMIDFAKTIPRDFTIRYDSDGQKVEISPLN